MARLEAILTRELSPADALAFDAFVDAARGGAYAQARAWAPAAVAGRRMVPRWFLARRRGRVVGAALVLRPRAVGPLALPVAIVERGPVVDDLADLGEVLGALRRACLARGVVRLSVMPYWAGDEAARAERVLAREGFRLAQAWDGAHARTLRVDLRGELFAGKSGEALRRKLRQAERAGAASRRGGEREIEALARLHEELMGGQGRSSKPAPYWEALAELTRGGRGAVFACEHDGATVSALYASRHGRVATFVVGASSAAERSFSKMAPAMAEAIRWAKAEGCAVFDMGGIPLEGDPDEKRRSIAQFKLDFAKAKVELVREHARVM